MKTKIFSKSLVVLLGCTSLLALAQGAQAQSTGVETVMVKVEHRSENQQDVPVSTSTLSGDSLDSIFQSGEDIKAIAAHTPSLYAESSNGRAALLYPWPGQFGFRPRRQPAGLDHHGRCRDGECRAEERAAL
jgi:hypothetical protein